MRWTYSSHQLTDKLTFDPATAFRVDVEMVSARIVGLPLGSSQDAMYSGSPMGVSCTDWGVDGEELLRFRWEGKVVERTPVLDRASKRRARTVDSLRVGMR